jgi:hypothetical protein
MSDDFYGIDPDLTTQLATTSSTNATRFGDIADRLSSIAAAGQLDATGAVHRLHAMEQTSATLGQLLNRKVIEISGATYVGLPIEHFAAELRRDLGDGDGSSGMDLATAIEIIARQGMANCVGPTAEALTFYDVMDYAHDPAASDELRAAAQYFVDHPNHWLGLGQLDGVSNAPLSFHDIELMRASPEIVAALLYVDPLDGLDGALDGRIDPGLITANAAANLAIDADTLAMRNMLISLAADPIALTAVSTLAAANHGDLEENSWYEDPWDWALELGEDLIDFVDGCLSGIDDVEELLTEGMGPAALGLYELGTLSGEYLAALAVTNPWLVVGAGVVTAGALVSAACLLGTGDHEGWDALIELIEDAQKGSKPSQEDIVITAAEATAEKQLR